VNAGKDIPIPAPSSIKEIRVMNALDMLEDYYRPVYGSKRPKSDPEDIFTWEAGISQQLPWGPQIFITNSIVKHRMRYDWEGHSYEADWTANLSAELLMPLPFTANFGPLAPSDVNVRTARFDKERAYWDVRTVIDTTLYEASVLYWTLLDRAMLLRYTTENRSAVGEMARKLAELFEAERVTAYGKGQVDAELARLEALEADAWSAYVQASAALVEYLDLPPETLLVPVGWQAPFDADPAEVDAARAVETALAENPGIRAARVSLERSELLEDFYRHQRRPAITADILTNFQQIGETYGYKDPAVALQNLFDTDKRTTTYAISYSVPLGNVPARAAHQRARAERDETGLVLAQTERDVVRRVRDAVASLRSARARVTLAAEKLRAAEEAYGNAVDLRGAGRIGEYELVRRSQDLLSARTAWASARIRREVAEVELLAATGGISPRFAAMTAATPFERYRLAVLRAAGILRFF
jgi:outer membrane protein TolC